MLKKADWAVLFNVARKFAPLSLIRSSVGGSSLINIVPSPDYAAEIMPAKKSPSYTDFMSQLNIYSSPETQLPNKSLLSSSLLPH